MKKHVFSLTTVLFGAAAALQAQDDPNLTNITTLEQLDAMRYDLDGDGRPSSSGEIKWKAAFSSPPDCANTATCTGYELMANLDFEDADSYAADSRNDKWVNPDNGGTSNTKGWKPIGENFQASFSAVFEGNSHTISNLYINRSDLYVGLFGYMSFAEVQNVGLVEGNVTGLTNAGSLAGYSIRGTISACYTTGNVAGRDYVGGLVGRYEGNEISMSYATGNATGKVDVGGLVGFNTGKISACYTTGNVNGVGERSYAGGLVGQNEDTISACYATGDVTAEEERSYAGGLVGRNESEEEGTYGLIRDSYATGNATAEGESSSAGGLVVINSGRISSSYATGNATAEGEYAAAGGLVGGNNEGRIFASYATGSATASATKGITPFAVAGGLAAYSSRGGIRTCHATGNAIATGEKRSAAGGLVGHKESRGTIHVSYATGNAAATGDESAAGGLVGTNDANVFGTTIIGAGAISASYATGNATATGNESVAGGLVGENIRSGTISACYSAGNATATKKKSYAGGLVGSNDVGVIIASYATGSANAEGTETSAGGLMGHDKEGTIKYSYFDYETSGRKISETYAQSSSALQARTDYSGIYKNWNVDIDGKDGFDDPWDFGTDKEYPALQVDFDENGTASAAEFGDQPRNTPLRVTNISPTGGSVDATVTITGTGFSDMKDDNIVTFLGGEGTEDDKTAAVTSSTPTSLEVTVPMGTATGPISVMVGSEADTSSQRFRGTGSG